MIGATLILVFCVRNTLSFSSEVDVQRKCGRVHLTISSYQDTYLEMNWITDCEYPDNIRPDYIALYNNDLRDRSEEPLPLVKIRAADHPEGYYKTKIKFGQPWLPGNWEHRDTLIRTDPGPHCFPYWITSIKGGEIVDTKCLGIQPTWMNDNRFFINHDLVRISRIEPIFKEIRKFVQLAPKEIIIVDFHRFPYPSNFNASLHNRFVNLIHEHLGDLALPPGGLQVGKGPSLNEIWAQNKNLIICYADKATARDNYWLWQPLQQHWGDTKNIGELKNFLSRAIREHRVTLNPMFALMAELTPQTFDLIFRSNSLRKLANDVNRKVTKWFRDDWAKDANIVATDYFLGNDIINVAIEANINK